MKLLKVFALVVMFILALALPCSAETIEAHATFESETHSDTGADNDTLFESYVSRLFNPMRLRSAMNVGGRLTGHEAAAYAALKPWVADIAAGNVTSSVYTLSLAELDQVTWTADELGIDEIVVDGTISEDAMNAAFSKYDVNISAVLNALMSDSPYELYWYDKITGTTTNTEMSFSATHDGTQWTMTVNGQMMISMAVASEYAGDADYIVDPSKVQTAVAAVEHAADIVAQYAGASDYEKLAGYRQAICGLVSYNYDAAGDDTTAYGNPWQLIWVFDGDSSTNVVCEGYSKAFQYLCDRTSFSGSVTCYTVTGTMSGGTGAGDHMWNIIRMSDGNNYLVDVTNCDSGSVGADDLLFMAGYVSGSASEGYVYACGGTEIIYMFDDTTINMYTADELLLSNNGYDPNAACAHEWDEGVVTLEPTCEQDGYITYTCLKCGQTNEEIIHASHLWDEPEWIWAEDRAGAEAVFVCARDNSHKQIIPADVTCAYMQGDLTGTYLKTWTASITSETAPDGDNHYDIESTQVSVESASIMHRFGERNFSWVEIAGEDGKPVFPWNPNIDGDMWLQMTVNVSDGSTFVPESVTWTSSDTSIATIDANGNCTALSEGEVTFSATDELSGFVISDNIDITITGVRGYLDNLIYVDNSDYISILKYTGSETTVEIPESINGIPVTTIESSAFQDSKVYKAILPETITTIRDWAFNTIWLSDVNLPVSLTNIGSFVFNECAFTEYTVPGYIRTVGHGMFSNCRKLTAVELQFGVRSVDAEAFSNCSKLAEITIPQTVTSISNNAFDGCDVLAIHGYEGSYAQTYAQKKGIPFVSIGIIDQDELLDMYFPQSEMTVGLDDSPILSLPVVLTPRTANVTLTYESDNPTVATVNEDQSITLNEQGKAVILCRSSSGMQTEMTLTIKKGTYIPVHPEIEVMHGATSPFKDVQDNHYEATWNPNNGDLSLVFTYYGSSDGGIVFWSSSDETVATINDKGEITYLKNGTTTFTGIHSYGGLIASVTITYNADGIPFSLDGLIGVAYNDSRGAIITGYEGTATSLTIPETIEGYPVVTIGPSAFRSSSIKSLILPDTVTAIGERAFDDCFYLQSVEMSSNLETIGVGAFWQCESLRSIDIPSGVSTVNESVFNACVNLVEVTMHDGLKTIGSFAFGSCRNLQSITLPDTVTQIDDWAFSKCSSISVFTIPSGVAQIGNGVFEGCSELTQIQVEPGNVTYTSKDGVLFKGKTLVSFPAGRSGNYAIPEGTTTINSYAFSQSNKLTSVHIPESLEYVSEIEFSECKSLISCTVDVGNAVYCSIGGVLCRKYSNQLMTLPGGVGSNYRVPEGVLSLGSLSVCKCNRLKNLYLPDSLESIERSAVFGCENLSTITIGSGIRHISSNAFSANRSLTSIRIQASEADVTCDENAFPDGVEVIWDYQYVCTEHQYDSGIVTDPTCTEGGYTTYTCIICGDSYQDNETESLGHVWGEVTYEWSRDNSEVTATRICAHDAAHIETETVTATSVITTAATCLAKGQTTYTSAAFENEAFEVQTKTLEDVAALGHAYGAPVYEWSADNRTVTATRICENDAEHVETETVAVTSEVTLEPTYENKGETTYTSAEFENEAFEVQTKTLADIDALTSDQIVISETNYPDANFRAFVLELEESYGNGDGEWSAVEINQVFDINVASRSIKSLQGIEYFVAIQRLNCSDNQLITLDVSQNTVLERLWCGDNQLTTLNVGGNPALQDLDCRNNQLTTLNVSGAIALMELRCFNNQLIVLNVSENPALKLLWCHENQLTALDVSANPALENLWCNDNQLTTLIVSGATALEQFVCSNNKLASLNVNGNPALENFYCDGNQLTELDVSGNSLLKYLICYRNQLTTLLVNGATALEQLICENNQLTTLDVGGNSALQYLNCRSNQLTALDVSMNPVLKDLYFDGNQLTILDVSRNPMLARLSCKSNQLTTLDVSRNSMLIVLDCAFNQLKTLDVSANPVLEHLLCDVNELTTLKVNGAAALEYLDCKFNQLTMLDVTQNALLSQLVCCGNQMSVLDISENSKIVQMVNEEHYHYFASGNTVLYGNDDYTNHPYLLCDSDVQIIGGSPVIIQIEWGEPTYTWSDDYSACTAERVDQRDSSNTQTETVDAACTETKAATCEEPGEITYTAEFENEAFVTQSIVLVNTPVLGHDYGAPVYEWSADNRTVTATRICENDAEHVETETVAAMISISKSPTETEVGETTYTGSFENSAFLTQMKVIEDIPSLNDMSLLRLPIMLKTIEAKAFEGAAFEAVIVPDGCTSIGARAFDNCSNLIYIRIPASVTAIADDAFEGNDHVRIDRIQ